MSQLHLGFFSFFPQLKLLSFKDLFELKYDIIILTACQLMFVFFLPYYQSNFLLIIEIN